MNATSPRYVKPKKATNFFNESVGRLTRMGISVYGSRVLYVRGRKSGEWRSNPVNPLTVDGTRYLVAPRGNTQWVRNLRAAEAPANCASAGASSPSTGPRSPTTTSRRCCGPT